MNQTPPPADVKTTDKGRPADEAQTRRIGVEVEFGGLTAREAAETVKRHLGGRIVEEDPHLFSVEDTVLGTIRLELDSKYVHTSSDASKLERKVRSFAGEVGGAIVPTEMITGPLPASRLAEVDALIGKLVEAGAVGTRQPHLACGLHLNIEWPEQDIGSILSVFRAYLLLAPELRREIDPDMTRTLLPFIGRFPRAFEEKVLDPSYSPDLKTFIRDYCSANPNKNRELDLLPLLASVDEELVAGALGHEPQAVRPTFHYRLPDARLGEADWSVRSEWKRWLKVEALASDEAALEARLARRKDRDDASGPVRSIKKLLDRVMNQ
ncbi:MAG: hypothetical protein Tsb0019_18870 [Roseibium sp.]